MPTVFELLLAYALIGGAWWALRRVRLGAAVPDARPAATAWRMLPSTVRRRTALVAGAVAVLAAGDAGYWLWQRFGTRELRVTFLSVGQGDAAVAELPGGSVLVIDGGGFPGGFDPGERVIAPFLRSRKIMHVDVLVLSHPQLDHYGGLAYLAEHFRPHEIWWNGTRAPSMRFARLENALAAAGATARVVRPGTSPRRLGDVRVDVVHPDDANVWGANDGSVVLRLAYGRASLLFTGDVERSAEAAIAAAPRAVAATVLKVPHHGSRTSSSSALLAAVRPEVAVVSAGAGNRFGFPAGVVRGRLHRAGAELWETPLDGAVEVLTDGRRLRVSTPCRARPARELIL
jgi:competence protein ComEC